MKIVSRVIEVSSRNARAAGIPGARGLDCNLRRHTSALTTGAASALPSCPMDLRPVSTGPTHRFAGVKNVLVCVYLGAPQGAALRERVPWIEETIARHGAVGLLVVVDARATGKLPDADFRNVSREQAARYKGRILFSASVVEGNDVHHALLRTFMRGLALVAGRDIPLRFFDAVRPAAEWAANKAHDYGGPAAEELERSVQLLRPSEIDERSP
jgi:hypothetical protein